MLGTLTQHTEAELLEFARLILSRPGPLSRFDVTELDQINTELRSRNDVTELDNAIR